MIWTINWQMRKLDEKSGRIAKYFINIWFFLFIPIYVKIERKYYL